MAKLNILSLCLGLGLACALAAAQEDPATPTEIPPHPPVGEPHPPADEAVPEAVPEEPVPPVMEQQAPSPPAECLVSEWKEWGGCSKACEGGSYSRSRDVISNGTLPCPELNEQKACNTHGCSISWVHASQVEAWPQGRASIEHAIDGNPETWTYSTKGWCNEDTIYVALSFMRSELVSGVRVLKKYQESVKNSKDCNRKNIQLLYSTDPLTETLSRMAWKPVVSAKNGHKGHEKWNAQSVADTGMVVADEHDSDADGWGSVSFKSTHMTALALEITSHGGLFNHFCLAEIQAFRAMDAASEEEL